MGGSSKKQTVGYRYFLGMHMILCHGEADKLIRIRVDDKNAWLGNSTGGQITVNASNLFGGESREGGVSGTVDIEMGSATQGQNSYLVSKLGSLVPSFRGVVGVVLRQCYLGVNPYLKKWAFRLQRIHKAQDGETQWYDDKSEIQSGESSGAFDSEYFDANSFSSNDFPGYSISGNAARNTLQASIKGSYYRRAVGSHGLYAKKITFNFKILSANINDACNVAISTSSGAEWFNFTARRSQGVDSLQRPSINNFYLGGTPIGTTALEVGTLYLFLIVFDLEANVGAFEIRDGSSVVASGAVNIPAGQAIHYIGLTRDDDAAAWSQIEYSNINLEGSFNYADMNPSHIIRECLTNKDWGMGYQSSDIDDTSFTAAADSLHSEGMGISLLWNRQTSIEEFIKEIVKHIDAALFVDRQTGKFTLKLIRNDYVLNDLIVLNPSNIDKITDFTRPAFGELTNSITVNYWDSATGTDASLTVQDIALSQIQGVTINTTVQYPGFTKKSIASRIAQRDLKTLSTPLVSCTIYANRTASPLNIGQCFKLTWPDYDIENLVMRVTGIAYGDGRSNRVRISCSQDVFSLPETSFISPTPPVWEDPNSDAVAAEYRIVVEAPYFELVQRLGQTEADQQISANSDIGYLIVSAAAPAGSINGRIVVDTGAGYDENGDMPMDFCPVGFLTNAVGYDDTIIQLSNFVASSSVVLGTHAQIGTELVKITAVASDSITVGRGVLDTVPTSHNAGTPVLFWDAFGDSDNVEYVTNETINVKILPTTGRGSLQVALAPEDSLTFAARAFRPYPPGKLQINGEFYPVAIGANDALSLSWAHRDRLQQTAGDIVDTTADSIGPEAGTTYNLRIYGETNTLIRTYAALSGTSQVYDNATELADGGSVTEDPYWTETKLLLNFNGADNSTTFTDSSSVPKTATVFGNAKITTSDFLYGGASGIFDGNGDYVLFADHADFKPGSGDFTIEFYMKLAAVPSVGTAMYVLGCWGGTNRRFTVSLFNNAGNMQLNFVCSINGITSLSAGGNGFAYTLGTRYFIQCVKSGTETKIYINSVQHGTTGTVVGALYEATPADFAIGTQSTLGGYFNGTLEDLRYTKGIARPVATPNQELGRYIYESRLNGKLRIELESVRNSVLSLQKHNYTVLREGYGGIP